ncbi:Multiple antibiotic resistance protein MarA [Enterobacter cloacae]|nr:Multiple antibiotic resistance protein MarA [Enterobacter cloacae]CAH5625886.1 Multiple antibiotic resistance protein MarA [Enterobacter cloacae]
MRVTQNGIYSVCLCSTKAKVWGATSARKLLMAARDLRESDERVYDICLRYGFDSQQTFTRIFTRTFNQPPGAYRKENHGRAH